MRAQYRNDDNNNKACAKISRNTCPIIIIIIIKHEPKSVETSQGGTVTILWNQQVQTDRTVRNNKPDITIRDNEKGTCMLIDVAI
jgi:hypothetical protein